MSLLREHDIAMSHQSELNSTIHNKSLSLQIRCSYWHEYSIEWIFMRSLAFFSDSEVGSNLTVLHSHTIFNPHMTSQDATLKETSIPTTKHSPCHHSWPCMQQPIPFSNLHMIHNDGIEYLGFVSH